MADYFQGVEVAAETAAYVLFELFLNNINDAYNDLARDYYNDYYDQRNFYYTKFQIGGEAPFAAEQFGIQFYVPDYFGMDNVGYFPPGVWFLFNPQLTNRKAMMGDASTEGYWKRFTERYSPNVASTVLDTSSYAIDTASIFDDWNSYMNRYEEHKRDVFNERRWANRMGTLSFGVKQAYSVERGLATSFDTFDKAQGEIVSEVNTIANGLATFAGYRQMQGALQKELGTSPAYTGTFFSL